MEKSLCAGDCSSPSLDSLSPRACSCPELECVRHGRCCDCLAFHRKMFSMGDAGENGKDLGWLPKCYFPLLKERYGYEPEKDWGFREMI